jgi:hypothetical protein
VNSNDQQIDLLIRRFASGPALPNNGTDHLDADELNAFAEGVLPPAARAQYISHLAECDQCRRQVSDLALASGAIARLEPSVSQEPVRGGIGATLAKLFAPPVLRYAAVAAVLVLVAGVAYLALRQRPESQALVAQNDEAADKTNAVKASTETNGGLSNTDANRRDSAATPATAPAPGPLLSLQPPAGVTEKPGDVRTADSAAPPAPAAKEPAKAMEAEKKSEETTIAKNRPYYSPPPPGETQSIGGSQSQTGILPASPGGPRQQTQQQMDKSAADRERDLAKDARADDANRKSEQPVLAADRRGGDEKLKGGPSRNMDNVALNNRNATNEVRNRAEAPKTDSGASTEDNSQPRSVGGRKFRRQGNAWVDQKFKSSMSLKNVSRGSDEFSSLDSGLRSIAQQLGGEVIVVWKGKAYLIK